MKKQLKYANIISKLSVQQKADLMTGRDFWSTLNIDELGIPSAYLSDGPHGLRKQAAAADHLGLNPSIPATCYPTAATMANSWDTELGEKLGVELPITEAVYDVCFSQTAQTGEEWHKLCMDRIAQLFSRDTKFEF